MYDADQTTITEPSNVIMTGTIGKELASGIARDIARTIKITGSITTTQTITLMTASHTIRKMILKRRPTTISPADRIACHGYIPGSVTITSAKKVLTDQYIDSSIIKTATSETIIAIKPSSNKPAAIALLIANTPSAAGTI
jgi:hypothetical protein